MDDLAPVVCVPPGGSGGEKSKLGSAVGGVGVEVDDVVLEIGSSDNFGGGDGDGCLDAMHRTE